MITAACGHLMKLKNGKYCICGERPPRIAGNWRGPAVEIVTLGDHVFRVPEHNFVNRANWSVAVVSQACGRADWERFSNDPVRQPRTPPDGLPAAAPG